MDSREPYYDPLLYNGLKSPVLLTPRLVLRAPHMIDVDAIADFTFEKTSQVTRDKSMCVLRAQAMKSVKRAQSGKMGHCVYAITLASTGTFIGSCHISYKPELEAFALNFWIGEAFQKRGYATETLEALIDMFFRSGLQDELRLTNRRSDRRFLRVIDNVGFSLIGKVNDEPVYSLSRETWLQRHVIMPRYRKKPARQNFDYAS